MRRSGATVSVNRSGALVRAVVQRILGHASATMKMDLYGHLIDQNLWDAAKKVGGLSGASKPSKAKDEADEGPSTNDEGEEEKGA